MFARPTKEMTFRVGTRMPMASMTVVPSKGPAMAVTDFSQSPLPPANSGDSSSAGVTALGAVGHKVGQHTDRGPAEGMAEQVDALDAAVVSGLAPVREHRFLVGLSVAVVAVLLRMGNAVVDGRAGQGRIHFAGAVPGAADRAEARSDGFVPLFSQAFRKAAAETAPVGHELIDEFVFTEPQHAVAEHERVTADFLFLCHSFTSPFSFDTIHMPLQSFIFIRDFPA